MNNEDILYYFFNELELTEYDVANFIDFLLEKASSAEIRKICSQSKVEIFDYLKNIYAYEDENLQEMNLEDLKETAAQEIEEEVYRVKSNYGFRVQIELVNLFGITNEEIKRLFNEHFEFN